MVLSAGERRRLTGRETTANDLARRVVLVVLVLTFFALAALMWPSQASAQIACEPPGCRPLCESGFDADSNQTVPLYTLTAGRTGAGDGTFAVTALNPYAGATYNSPANKDRECAKDGDMNEIWDVEHWCTFHCEHRHYFVQPGGLPQPATAWITATADGSSHFLGWTNLAEGCVPPASLAHGRDVCVQKMDQNRTATAEFGTAADATPPTAPTIARTATQRNTVTFAVTTASTDETWLGGYEVYVNNVLRTRVRPDATTFTIANLLCNTDYAFRIDAFDSEAVTSSNVVNATTNSCPKVAPNAVFHVKPPRRTRQKTAFFHWGARRGGVDLPQHAFKSRCKVDKRRWTKCSAVSGETVRRLKPGWHTFRVKVGDAQGWDRTPAIWRWQVRR